MGRGKPEERERPAFFPLPIVPSALPIFSIIATLIYKDTQREPLQRREVQTDNCQSEMAIIEQLVDQPRRPMGSQSGREKGRQN